MAGAGLICRGGSPLHLIRQKRRAMPSYWFLWFSSHPSCGFYPTLLVVLVVGLLCACPRCFLAAHVVTSNTLYKLAAPRILFFLTAFVTRLLTPRSQKPGYGLLLGCRSGLDSGREKNLFFAPSTVSSSAMFEKQIGQ